MFGPSTPGSYDTWVRRARWGAAHRVWARATLAIDIVIPGRSRGALLVRAYQRWAGAAAAEQPGDPAAEPSPDATIEAAVLKLASETARLRPLGEDHEITLRGSSTDIWKLAPGQIIRVKPRKSWSHRGYRYMSGQIQSARVDAGALHSRPLSLHHRGPASAVERYGADLDALWSIASGPADIAYELERLVPGADQRDDDAPIVEAVEPREAGDFPGAEKALMHLLHADVRCLDAHALLGHWALEASFTSMASKALLHFEVGMNIAELSLGSDFDGRLPWALVDNRPYLRCVYGYGVALWRQGRTDEARHAFERLCALNPADELQARCWKAVSDGLTWGDWSSEA